MFSAASPFEQAGLPAADGNRILPRPEGLKGALSAFTFLIPVADVGTRRASCGESQYVG